MTTPLDVSGASVVVDTTPNAMMVLYFPQGNDVVVNVYYPNVSDGTGASSEFYYKPERETPDSDPTTKKYTADVIDNPDSTGTCMSTFHIPSADNQTVGALWWRADLVDSSDNRSTVGYGTVIVEAMLWCRVLNIQTCRTSCSSTGLVVLARQSYTGEFLVTSMPA
jgi:hypothetical protein